MKIHKCIFAVLALRMFHVKRLQTEEAAINLFIDISEVQQVGSEGANTQGNRKQSYTSLKKITASTKPRVLWLKAPGNLQSSRNPRLFHKCMAAVFVEMT